jgi:hypothetical protein
MRPRNRRCCARSSTGLTREAGKGSILQNFISVEKFLDKNFQQISIQNNNKNLLSIINNSLFKMYLKCRYNGIITSVN